MRQREERKGERRGGERRALSVLNERERSIGRLKEPGHEMTGGGYTYRGCSLASLRRSMPHCHNSDFSSNTHMHAYHGRHWKSEGKTQHVMEIFVLRMADF